MPSTIPEMLRSFVDRDPSAIAVRWLNGGQWRAATRHEVLCDVARLARALHDHYGVTDGTPVGILSETRPEWSAVDHAVLALGGVVVGVYPTLTPEQIRWILNHAGVRLLVVEGAALAERARGWRDDAVMLSIDPAPGLEQLTPTGPADLDWLAARIGRVRPEQDLAVIYTSGTTGSPKGAVLTHAARVATCVASREVAPLQRGDRSVVFLPLAHSFQRFAGYRGLLEDAEGWYCPSIKDLPRVMTEARPTVLASVPRMLEKIKLRAEDAAAARGPRAARVFGWAIGVGRRVAERRHAGAPISLRDQIALRVADRLVLSKVRARLGGHLRFIVSGSARLDPDVGWWFEAIGVPVLEGWGLTETCAPATANRAGRHRVGTVGPPIPGMEIKLAADGEVFVRGPGLFRGYLHDPDATAAAFEEGWYKTGDIGAIDDDGALRIVDRKKEILVTAGGKNVPPVNLELLLGRSPVVGQAIVVGDGRPYLVALLSPDPDGVDALCARLGVPDGPLDARLADPGVRAAFADAVAAANRELARFEQIKRFEVLPRPLDAAHDELTATLKPRRKQIAHNWSATIDRLYA
jgi:long-chain acyl-CoA synthetase